MKRCSTGRQIGVNYNKIYRLLVWGVVFLLCTGAFSCKSHKKAKKDDFRPVIESVETSFEGIIDQKDVRTLIVEEALTWVGTPYAYGHAEKGRATDCSGLVVTVFKEIGDIKLPRNSAEQANFCEEISEKEVDTADLVFFATGSDKKKVSHVGIMIDGNKFVHASGSKGVIISEMTTPYYKRTFLKYGRVTF